MYLQSLMVMKKRFLFCIALLSFNQMIAQNLTETRNQLENYLQKNAQNGYAGSVLVAQKGTILIEKGYGFADRATQKPETAETIFSVGSITKQFTAAAIMRLVADEKLKTSDKLSQFFSEVPADKKDISIHQLLTHTAGFKEALGGDYDNVNAEQFAQIAFQSNLLNPPGKEYLYTNVGYSLLGIIVEKVSGMGYEKFLHDRLFVFAGMTHTGYLIPKFKKEQLATGYRNGQRWGTALDRPWLSDGPSWHLRANGGILSTVGDMYKWYNALKNNTILPKRFTDLMFIPYVAEGPRGLSHYGYGWTIQKTSTGQTLIWHNGGNGTYNAIMSFDLAKDECLIVSSNTNDKISDDIALPIHLFLNGDATALSKPQPKNDEPDYQNHPVGLKISAILTEKGAENFQKNYQQILQNVGFDFDNDMILLGVGEKCLDAEKWDNAIALYSAYTALFPKIVVAWNHLGRAYLGKGDKAKAKECWQKSLSIRPNNNRAVEFLKQVE